MSKFVAKDGDRVLEFPAEPDGSLQSVVVQGLQKRRPASGILFHL